MVDLVPPEEQDSSGLDTASKGRKIRKGKGKIKKRRGRGSRDQVTLSPSLTEPTIAQLSSIAALQEARESRQRREAPKLQHIKQESRLLQATSASNTRIATTVADKRRSLVRRGSKEWTRDDFLQYDSIGGISTLDRHEIENEQSGGDLDPMMLRLTSRRSSAPDLSSSLLSLSRMGASSSGDRDDPCRFRGRQSRRGSSLLDPTITSRLRSRSIDLGTVLRSSAHNGSGGRGRLGSCSSLLKKTQSQMAREAVIAVEQVCRAHGRGSLILYICPSQMLALCPTHVSSTYSLCRVLLRTSPYL